MGKLLNCDDTTALALLTLPLFLELPLKLLFLLLFLLLPPLLRLLLLLMLLPPLLSALVLATMVLGCRLLASSCSCNRWAICALTLSGAFKRSTINVRGSKERQLSLSKSTSSLFSIVPAPGIGVDLWFLQESWSHF